jgi:hypothetical protein
MLLMATPDSTFFVYGRAKFGVQGQFCKSLHKVKKREAGGFA